MIKLVALQPGHWLLFCDWNRAFLLRLFLYISTACHQCLDTNLQQHKIIPLNVSAAPILFQLLSFFLSLLVSLFFLTKKKGGEDHYHTDLRKYSPNSDQCSSSHIKMIQCLAVCIFNSFWDGRNPLPSKVTSEGLEMLQNFRQSCTEYQDDESVTAGASNSIKALRQRTVAVNISNQVRILLT